MRRIPLARAALAATLLAAALAATLLGACGGSSSETPWPVPPKGLLPLPPSERTATPMADAGPP